jgi:hypothetical protein
MQDRNKNSQPKRERSAPLSIQFNQGKYAFTKGWLGNPYESDKAQGKEWQRGFNAAYFENLDKRLSVPT